MIPRERVLTALGRVEPDRVPLFYRDAPEVEKRLIRELGRRDREDLLRFLEIDFRWVGPAYVGPPLEDEQSGRKRDIWGVPHKYVPFSNTAGYWEVETHPLKDCDNPDDLDDYRWPSLDWFDFSTLKDQIVQYDNFAIMTAPDYSSPGILQSPIQKLVGDEKSLIDIAANPDFFDALVSRILDFQLPFIDRMLSSAGGRIDFFRIGDDFGTQRALLIGRPMWRERIRPALRAMVDVAARHGAHCYLHSCCAVRDLIADFVDIGIEVLDPVQVQAMGMEPKSLKTQYGNTICFSGGVDEQQLLREGTPRQVREGIFQLLEDMAGGGGFFVGPTHNLQDDIPTENILAMYEAARDFSY